MLKNSLLATLKSVNEKPCGKFVVHGEKPGLLSWLPPAGNHAESATFALTSFFIGVTYLAQSTRALDHVASFRSSSSTFFETHENSRRSDNSADVARMAQETTLSYNFTHECHRDDCVLGNSLVYFKGIFPPA